ncbi:hypothetical protein KC367_g3515 [Hortaea werneckii]|uniref:Alpha-ketoglutarate-dependent dioxygenase AlkB-like domain-containing protein n=2 Tax=Hortaea werneckii TaxID=91943 RepID=A0A3M7IUM3_HORWE|nr:hypothetical protein KC358_g2522 [Hortaea werneckii]KAI6851076.1 hypothetical protein KC350_g1767 [Hortaea werneckii]KAI6942697.1 hypothetical protein KC341_g2044 [Hortaea werneckii]KAI6947516.1 hypothetical protein KC348_g2478 [Hortaea werneckii]KAI6980473.1 hypothetical protein KC321_g1755 [Hortaea werneckii]
MVFDIFLYQDAPRRSGRNVGRGGGSIPRTQAEVFKDLNEDCHGRDLSLKKERAEKKRKRVGSLGGEGAESIQVASARKEKARGGARGGRGGRRTGERFGGRRVSERVAGGDAGSSAEAVGSQQLIQGGENALETVKDVAEGQAPSAGNDGSVGDVIVRAIDIAAASAKQASRTSIDIEQSNLRSPESSPPRTIVACFILHPDTIQYEDGTWDNVKRTSHLLLALNLAPKALNLADERRETVHPTISTLQVDEGLVDPQTAHSSAAAMAAPTNDGQNQKAELDVRVHDMVMGTLHMPLFPPITPPQAQHIPSANTTRRGRNVRRPRLFNGLQETPSSDTDAAFAIEEGTPTPESLEKPLQKRQRKSSARKRTASSSTETPATKKRLKSLDTQSAPPTRRRSSAVSKNTPRHFPESPSKVIKLPVAQLPPTPPSSTASNGTDAINIFDEEMLALSRSLTHREPIASKPPPPGQPRVWADSRQALCETVPYFKKPQGGCHQNDGHVYAFLFDGVGHCREYMDSDVIIARAGGGMESDSNSGTMMQAKDQTMKEAQVVAMLNDAQLQNPLIVICGNKNTGALTKMPHKYNVLGWYKPIAVWAEKTAGKGKKNWTTIKYRMERLRSEEPAWHAPIGAIPRDSSEAGELVKSTCVSCGQCYPQIYLESWMCLSSSCDRFWRLGNGQEAPSGALTYNPAYLLHRTPWPVEEEPFDVRPRMPQSGKVIGDTLTYINTRGIVCPNCGRCNPRYRFIGWVCDNQHCNWEGLKVNHQAIMPAALHQATDTFGDGPSLGRNRHDPSISVKVSYSHGYKIFTYTVEGIEGRFVHAVANGRINREHHGPDDMFAALQTEDMGLERRRFNSEKLSGGKDKEIHSTPARSHVRGQLPSPPNDEPEPDEAEELGATQKPEADVGDFMTAFSMNYGMPYKFVASGASRPFEDSPWPVQACRSRLNWAQRTFLPDSATGNDEFNEELIFAYMEGQKIEYHDDGEEGLGPRIATLSLGGKAKMYLRMKSKHFVGCSKTGVFTPDRPVPGGIDGKEMDEQRLAAWNGLQSLKETNRAAYSKRLKEIPKELGLYSKKGKQAPDLVTVTLNHGDIVLMEGDDIQKYLEHKVVPDAHLRFALTCRVVLENHLKPEERPGYIVGPDDYGYDGADLL